jgi:lysophospholipase L1-like esterase
MIVVTAGGASAQPQGTATDYYLSIGDSLSIGVQPGADGVERPTDQGYDHDLLPGLQIADAVRGRSLRLTELGCSGETTTTMIHGGICAYPNASSQLAAATRFLAEHRGHVPLVTLAIGANDVDVCATLTGIDLNCVQQGLSTIMTNLTTIVTALKQADPGADTQWVGLNEYDPFLAAFLQGATGQQLAQQSLQLLAQLNQILAADYGPAGFRVADVAGAFRTTDSNPVPLPGVGQVPQDVASICQLTYMCAPTPVGPNIHPNADGYQTMARAIAGHFLIRHR